MGFENYYETLKNDGIKPSSTRAENCKRLQEALRRWQKAQNPDAQQRHKQINKALPVFSSDTRYRQFRKWWRKFFPDDHEISKPARKRQEGPTNRDLLVPIIAKGELVDTIALFMNLIEGRHMARWEREELEEPNRKELENIIDTWWQSWKLRSGKEDQT